MYISPATHNTRSTGGDVTHWSLWDLPTALISTADARRKVLQAALDTDRRFPSVTASVSDAGTLSLSNLKLVKPAHLPELTHLVIAAGRFPGATPGANFRLASAYAGGE